MDHSELVRNLTKSGEDICVEMNPYDAHAVHMSLGIAGETGELIDAVKKMAIYHRPLDRENVVEEMGDVEFYLEGLRQGFDITREEVIAHNIKKLNKRYSDGNYSDKQAKERADK